jgi:hypothetical protein
VIIIAHSTQITGKVSELTAARALIGVGWEIAQPVVDEVYDLIGYHPVLNEYSRFQIKTIRRRADRDNQRVIYATKGNGEAYRADEVDYIVGVENDSVFLTETRNLKEYWQPSDSSKRWIELTSGEGDAK